MQRHGTSAYLFACPFTYFTEKGFLCTLYVYATGVDNMARLVTLK